MTEHSERSGTGLELLGEDESRPRRLKEGAGEMWAARSLHIIWGNGPHDELERRELAKVHFEEMWLHILCLISTTAASPSNCPVTLCSQTAGIRIPFHHFLAVES